MQLIFNSLEELIAFCDQTGIRKVPAMAVPSVEPVKAPVVKTEPVEEPKKAEEKPSVEETKEEPVAPAQKTYSLAEVRAKLAELTKGGKKAQVKELLNSFGAEKLTDVKEEDYAALMEKAGEL